MPDSQTKTGKIVRSTRNKYIVSIAGKFYECAIRGRVAGLKRNAIKVGDNAKISLISESAGIIEEIMPRHSKLSRTVEGKAYKEHIIATNIDQLIVIMSTKKPDFKSGLLDRYLIIAEKNHLKGIICINKIDLADISEYQQYEECYKSLGYKVIFTSVKTKAGISEFESILKNNVSVLVGHSGVGKSSLIKMIEPDLDLKVGEISEYTNKGQHTTTHVELFPLRESGFIIDTPGVKELGLWDVWKDELRQYFVEFQMLESQCKFNDCKHLQEPDCAVKKAVESGLIFPSRYENYTSIYNGLRNASYELIKPRTLY